MQISPFSNAATQPFWALPVQTLAPWIARFKNSLSQIPVLPTAQRFVNTLQQAFTTENAAASNDSTFAIALEVVLPCKTASRSSLRVVREFDSTITPDCAGRMVISGRMADVCAELDRMALRAGTASQ